jgi:hypothetical protein
MQWSGNGHYYQIINMPYDIYGTTDWFEARDHAAGLSYMGMQGYLGTITSYDEQKFIQTLTMPDDCTVWIGGFQPSGSSEPSGNWQWVTGETFVWADYNSNGWGWEAGEPNDNKGEDCLEYNYFNDGQWNDQDCYSENYCILVEYEEELQPIPTMNKSGILILSAILAASAIWLIRRRKRTT